MPKYVLLSIRNQLLNNSIGYPLGFVLVALEGGGAEYKYSS